MQRDALIADPAGQVEGLPRQTVARELGGVARDALLQSREHLRRRGEVAVRRHEAVDPAVRPLEVVMVDEQPEPSSRVVEPAEERRLHAFAPQGPPESLDLAERLRMTRSGHDLADPAAVEQLGELALAAPRHVLRAVVGQHLLGCSEVGDRRLERLAHQRT